MGIIDFRGMRAIGATPDVALHQPKMLISGLFKQPLRRLYTGGWGTYERHLDPAQHTVGKQPMQTIESKHINWLTRIKRLTRRTLCFSKTTRHDLVIGLFINRYEFGVAI